MFYYYFINSDRSYFRAIFFLIFELFCPCQARTYEHWNFHKGNEDFDNDAYSVSTVNSDRDTNYCNSSKTSKTVLNDNSSEQSSRSGSRIDNSENKKNDSEAKESKLESYSVRLARYNTKEETSLAVNPELAHILGKALTTHIGYSEEMKKLYVLSSIIHRFVCAFHLLLL